MVSVHRHTIDVGDIWDQVSLKLLFRVLPMAILLSPHANEIADRIFHPPTAIVEASTASVASYMGGRVAAQAMTWGGAYYKKGVQAMCASWVRHVLELEGVTIPTAKGSAGPLMADSFHAPEQGKIILNTAELLPGDIVMFSNTYNGGGRVLNGGKITHVGIYVGNGMMVDRPTSRGTVKYRPISTFKFNSALRPNIYGVRMELPASAGLDDETLKRAIGRAEGTRNPDGTPNNAWFGHSDPGNRKHNLGSFSYQHGATSPEEADQKWLAVLRKAEPEIQGQAVAKFGQPLSKAALVAALDAYTQSPDAGKRFVPHLATADPSAEQLVAARTAALAESRRVHPGGPMNVSADQQRRVNALLEQLP